MLRLHAPLCLYKGLRSSISEEVFLRGARSLMCLKKGFRAGVQLQMRPVFISRTLLQERI